MTEISYMVEERAVCDRDLIPVWKWGLCVTEISYLVEEGAVCDRDVEALETHAKVHVVGRVGSAAGTAQ